MKGNGLWGLVILNQPVDIWVSDCVPNNWKVLLERTQQRNGEMCLLQYTKHLLSISTCDKCQRNNLKLNIVRLELHPIKVHSPWFHLGIDFFGPISPPSYSGNRYIFTLSDYFTKWVEAIPLPSKDVQGLRMLSSRFVRI